MNDPQATAPPASPSELCKECNGWRRLKSSGVSEKELKKILKRCGGCKTVVRAHKFTRHVNACHKVEVIDLTTDSDDEPEASGEVDIATDTE